MTNLLVEKSLRECMSLEKFKAAGLTKTQPDGSERFYIQNAKQDPEGRRVWCVIADDMTFNDLVALSPKEKLLVDLKFGGTLTWEDWTEAFNIQPYMLEEIAKEHYYGASLHKELTFEKLMDMT